MEIGEVLGWLVDVQRELSIGNRIVVYVIVFYGVLVFVWVLELGFIFLGFRIKIICFIFLIIIENFNLKNQN